MKGEWVCELVVLGEGERMRLRNTSIGKRRTKASREDTHGTHTHTIPTIEIQPNLAYTRIKVYKNEGQSKSCQIMYVQVHRGPLSHLPGGNKTACVSRPDRHGDNVV